MSQAESTARVQCVQQHKDSKDSFETEQKTRQTIEAIFEFLEDFKTNLADENRELTPRDKIKLRDLLQEFFKNRYSISLTSPLQNIQVRSQSSYQAQITKESLSNGDFEIPPTLLAVLVYDRICKSLKSISPYEQIKIQSIQRARIYKQRFLKVLHHKIKNAVDARGVLEFAIRICALGNVLDYGAQEQFDLEEQAQQILKSHFAFFDLEDFIDRIESARTLVIIGDNAGENEFDEILICALKKLYPSLEIFYFVRGAEIINDVTLLDLKKTNSEILNLVQVVDSGVMSPGFIKSLASKNAQEIYQKADVILAKGMGNFESMEYTAKEDRRIFLLFKVKCNVVKNYLQKNLGDFIFLNPYLHISPKTKNAR